MNINDLSSLPTELKLSILRQLTPQQLINLCQINLQYYQLCKDEPLWMRLVKEQFGNIPQLCNSWYQTYKIASLYNSFYVVSVADNIPREGINVNILGTYTNKRNAINLILNKINSLHEELTGESLTEEEIKSIIDVLNLGNHINYYYDYYQIHQINIQW